MESDVPPGRNFSLLTVNIGLKSRWMKRRYNSGVVRASALALLFVACVLSAQDPSGKEQSSVSQSSDQPCVEIDTHKFSNPPTVTVNGVEEPVYRLDDKALNGMTPPRPIKQKPPEFTEQVRKEKVHGIVTLAVVVTREGNVVDARVMNGCGRGLDEEAVKAVRTWKFKPAIKDGKPVAVQIFVEVDFHHN
jgi:TonB family protein